MSQFLNDETGAVTIDWTVFLGASVAIGLATMALIRTGAECGAHDVNQRIYAAPSDAGSGAGASIIRASDTMGGSTGACADPPTSFFKYGASNHDGPSDLSASYEVEWNDEVLKVAFDVLDDVVRADETRHGHAWMGDSVEIYLDLAGNGGSSYDDNDFQFVIGVDGSGDIDLHKDGRRLRSVPGGVSSTFAETSEGYRVTFTGEWSALGLSGPPRRGTGIGFGAAINDYDTGSRTNTAVTLNFAAENMHTRPGEMATMILD